MRNPRAGKNQHDVSNKEVKGVVKKSFKKALGSMSKQIEKIEEVLNKEVKVKNFKSKDEEEKYILDRMRQLQYQHIDTVQACEGWFRTLNATNVHVDMDAVQFVQERKHIDMGNECSLDQRKPRDMIDVHEKFADMQDNGVGTELPNSKAMSQ